MQFSMKVLLPLLAASSVSARRRCNGTTSAPTSSSTTSLPGLITTTFELPPKSTTSLPGLITTTFDIPPKNTTSLPGLITTTFEIPPKNTTSLPGLITTSFELPKPTSKAEPYKLKTPLLDTPWTEKVGTKPWQVHPRPMLKRDTWQNLNGIWTFQPAEGESERQNPPRGSLAREVLIPSCIESAVSGIMEHNITHMWFATQFQIPANWSDQSVLLNFDAVDYEATVFINGQEAGFNRGGYFRFTIDATRFINFGTGNQLTVFVRDPTDSDPELIPIGKQTRKPGHIFYTPCSGIWQSVWLESAPKDHITQLDISADMNGKVTVNVKTSSGLSAPVAVSVVEKGGRVITRSSGTSSSAFSFEVASPRLWSPDSPTLYDLIVEAGDDRVTSYTGFRTIAVGEVEGVKRPLLNGEFVFQFGTLDQGYWPDGIYTPPTLEAMIFDLKLLKKLGMNMVRKHIKIEPDTFYQACDQLGLLVIQDMVSMTAVNDAKQPSDSQQAEFQRQLELMVNQHKSYPSIVTWVIYNEGWGQLINPPWPEVHLTDVVRQLDPTRLVNAVTGWRDHGVGDFLDNHHYATPQCGTPFYSIASSPYDPQRIGFQGEFGGIGMNVSAENLWKDPKAISTINQTYELSADKKIYNHRAHRLLDELREQTELFACSGAVWTQTSDVEGEVNGLVTYDRRLMRADEDQWRKDIAALYEAAGQRGGAKTSKARVRSEKEN